MYPIVVWFMLSVLTKSSAATVLKYSCLLQIVLPPWFQRPTFSCYLAAPYKQLYITGC